MTIPSPPGRSCVTGASGFVGRALTARLDAQAQPIHLGSDDWRKQASHADFRDAIVFHLAARVHNEGATENAFALDNVEKTRVLAQAARAGGARRFVFVSSIKVNGEETMDRPFHASDPPNPRDGYARSKWEAEKLLASIDALETVVVRSPLVYGPGVKGNLRALLRLADSPWPLPFAGIHNRRSFIDVDDLARLLVECATAPQAAGATILAAHPEPASTPAIVRAMRSAFGRPARLLNVPPRLIESTATIAGAREKVRRLTRSLEVDAAAAQSLLGWTAQVSMHASVKKMVDEYRKERP